MTQSPAKETPVTAYVYREQCSDCRDGTCTREPSPAQVVPHEERTARMASEDKSPFVSPSSRPDLMGPMVYGWDFEESLWFVVDPTMPTIAGYLTECCGASGKGGGSGVICRKCHRDVDSLFGSGPWEQSLVDQTLAAVHHGLEWLKEQEA